MGRVTPETRKNPTSLAGGVFIYLTQPNFTDF